jgi:23S rRNA (cytosine1962-C5)-methyltransferase
VLRLKRGRERARVHPWVFKGEVADVGGVEPGGAVTVVDAAGRFIGRGLYNPRPDLCCRILTWIDEPIDARFFARRVDQALALRARPGGSAADGTTPAAGRLVWSEADGLPGFVVDRYGPVLVVQCLTLGMARLRHDLVRALRDRLGDLPVFSMDDPTGAAREGFTAALGWLDAAGPDSLEVNEDGVRLGVTFGRGHKTGLYLDQADNRRRVGTFAAGQDVLDVFAYTGAFACHALSRGGRRAVCIESSADAAAGARANLTSNGAIDRAEVREANAFDELRRLERQDARFGVIVLDPPPFARSEGSLEAALRGYKEVNLRAMRLLAPGGVLATFTCSHHVSEARFVETCREAAADAGVRLRVVTPLGQARDHPVILTVPETRYLNGLLLEAT